jgi:hypothetical protein
MSPQHRLPYLRTHEHPPRGVALWYTALRHPDPDACDVYTGTTGGFVRGGARLTYTGLKECHARAWVG